MMSLTEDDRRILDLLDAEAETLIGRAIGWCEIGSGSRNLAGLTRLHEELAAAFGRLPGRVESLALAPSGEVAPDGELRELPHSPALRVSVRPQAPVQVALTGHYDTVFPADTAFREVRRRSDGALHGPGIADMKGGLSVMLGALEVFERHGLAREVGYTVLVSPDEEIGSPASAALLVDAARRAHLGMTYEPAMPDGALASARKGSGNFHVVFRGRSAHAGREFSAGRNALAAAAQMAAALHALNGRWPDVTVNVARIDGGGVLNTVPDRAVLRFNVRAPDASAAAWASGEVERVAADAARDGIETSVHGGFNRPPKPFGMAQSRLAEAVGEVGALLDLELVFRASGGVCEGNNLHAAGLPNLDTLGVRGGDIHTTAEYAWPESFAERARLSAAVLMKLASGEIDAWALRRALASELASELA